MNQSLNYLLCSTIYVINKKNEFLFFKHPKLKKWVPPGGKIEPNELPHNAAIRECLEETGFQVELMGIEKSIDEGIIAPQGLEFNPSRGNCQAHLDFIYFARLLSNDSTKRSENIVQWFSLKNISELNTFPSIIKWCKKLLDHERVPFEPFI